MALSTAVSLERKSRVVGYQLSKGFFAESSPNLPQRISIFGEANTANQGSLSTDKRQITSAEEAGDIYGFGSPIHMMARIVLSQTFGVGGIPVIVYPQEEPGAATSTILDIEPTGTATKNGTHTIEIAGRQGIQGKFYDIDIVIGDGPAEITAKIRDVVNNILSSPVKATSDAYSTNLETKWKGLTSNDLKVLVNTNNDDLGITYAVNSVQTGSATPSISDSLLQIGNEWVTLLVNGYGTVPSIMDTLEAFNGIPSPTTPTGRYKAIIMRPFVAITGSVDEDPSSITDPRLNDVTIAIAPAPNSRAFPFEAAANMCVLYAPVAQNNPQLGVGARFYFDMPAPTEIGIMSIYNDRDIIVKKGCSTVDLVGGEYQVQDFVTTYHKAGEEPPQYAYVRDLVGIDFNVRYSYFLKEQVSVVDHVIANNDDTVTAGSVIKPKQWIQILYGLADELALRALIVDAAFMKESIQVSIGTSNPNRLETQFNYKRSGIVRVSSTTAQAGFNLGTLN